MARMQEHYKTNVREALARDLGIENPMAIPRLKKVVVSMGLGKASQDKKILEAAERDLAAITGQKAVVTQARKSVSNFKLREGMPIGAMVTLRGKRMFEFLDRLINAGIPRLRDFRGLKTHFDGRGNYSMGLAEQTVFSEINLDQAEYTLGMNITMVTTAGNDAHGRRLLELMGVPFRKATES